jgi:hypothetical protein
MQPEDSLPFVKRPPHSTISSQINPAYVVLCSWSGRQARPRTQHVYHHDTKVKPEAVTAIIELLMMGGRTPETRWAVNKLQNNKLKNCCICLVIYLNPNGIFGLPYLTTVNNLFTPRFYSRLFLSVWQKQKMCLVIGRIGRSQIKRNSYNNTTIITIHEFV